MKRILLPAMVAGVRPGMEVVVLEVLVVAEEVQAAEVVMAL